MLKGIDKILYKIPPVQKYCKKKIEHWLEQYKKDVEDLEAALEETSKALIDGYKKL